MTTTKKPASDSTIVELAYPWIDIDGREHAPDSTVTVPTSTARDLIRDGRARAAGDTTPKE